MRNTPSFGMLLLIGALLASIVGSPLMMVASGEQAGDIVVTDASISVDPSTPVDGSSTSISVLLSNVGSGDAGSVPVEVYIDAYQPGNSVHSEFASVDAGSSASVVLSHTFTESHLASTPGERVIVAYWQHDGQEAWVNKTIQVTSLPNLTVSQLLVSPSRDLISGEAFNVSVLISNSGGADAAASHLALAIGESAWEYEVPSIALGTSTWVNTSLNAPVQSGTLTATVNSNANDGVQETTASDNSHDVSITIVSPPNYFHEGEVQAIEATGSLDGPWTLSGEVRRMGGEGDSSVNMSVQRDGIGILLVPLDFTTADPVAEWSIEVNTTHLGTSAPGTYTLDMVIDPSQEVLQSTRFDDEASTSITIHPVPNVVVSTLAAAKPEQARPGESVNFTVSLQNAGTIAVSGTLAATFPCGTVQPVSALIPPPSSSHSGSVTVDFAVTTCTGQGDDLAFEAVWTGDSISHDGITTDNTASGSVSLLTTLRLRFLADEAWAPGLPLLVGGTYRYSIGITADEGSGSETFQCVDLIEGEELGRVTVEFTSNSLSGVIECTYEAQEVGDLQLAIIPSGSSVATKTSVWTVSLSGAPQFEDSGSRESGQMLLIGAAVVLMAVFAAAVILTRRALADADRETYEFCPACEGEIEGDEPICPYCDFELSGGYGRFHDCAKCDASVPSSMDHCPYCGAEQNVSDFYERRERRDIAIEEEEVEEDPEAYVSGTLDYEERIGDFGLSEEALESEWDNRLEEAESELDELAEREAELASIEEDETLDEKVTTTHLKQRILADDSEGLDEFLAKKGERRALKDDEVKLSASDADIRADIFEITGEDGVLPGEQVVVDELLDHSIGGEELPDSTESDFTSLSDEARHTEGLAEAVEAAERAAAPEIIDQSSDRSVGRKRRGIRRRKNGGDGADEAEADEAVSESDGAEEAVESIADTTDTVNEEDSPSDEDSAPEKGNDTESDESAED